VLTITVLLAGVMAVAGFLAWAVRMRFNHDTLQAQNEALQVYINIIAAFYGILVALVFVGLVTTHDATDAIVVKESTDWLFLLRISQSLPESPEKHVLTASILEAVEYIRDDEWPRMVHGDMHAIILHYPKLDKVWASLQDIDLKSESSRILIAQANSQFQQILDGRRSRLLHSEDHLRPEMWLILWVGAIFSISHAYFVGVRDPVPHILLTMMSAGLIFLLLYLVYEYQHPFQGDFRVEHGAFDLTIQRMHDICAPVVDHLRRK
jgi:hypothetical protein